jgi:hypothetical protein
MYFIPFGVFASGGRGGGPFLAGRGGGVAALGAAPAGLPHSGQNFAPSSLWPQLEQAEDMGVPQLPQNLAPSLALCWHFGQTGIMISPCIDSLSQILKKISGGVWKFISRRKSKAIGILSSRRRKGRRALI